MDGWLVKLADLSENSTRESMESCEKKKCAFTSNHLVPIVLNFIRNEPSLPSNQIRLYLSDYVRKDTVSDSMIQSIRKKASLVAYGSL